MVLALMEEARVAKVCARRPFALHYLGLMAMCFVLALLRRCQSHAGQHDESRRPVFQQGRNQHLLVGVCHGMGPSGGSRE